MESSTFLMDGGGGKVEKWIEENNVKFIRLQFVDINGMVKNLAVPSKQIDKILDNELMLDVMANNDKEYTTEFVYSEDKNIHFYTPLGNIWIKSINDASPYQKIKSIYECIKYITKYSDNLGNDIVELVENLSGVRALSSWGILYGIEKDSEKQEDIPMSEIKDRICKTCGSQAFEIIDNVSNEEIFINDVAIPLNLTISYLPVKEGDIISSSLENIKAYYIPATCISIENF